MHAPSLWGILIVLLLAFILFGRPGKLSGLMEDLGKGIKGFRKGLGDEQAKQDAAPGEPPRQIRDQTGAGEAAANRDKTQA